VDKQLQFLDFGNCTDKLLAEGLVWAGEEKNTVNHFLILSCHQLNVAA
jgi:hypothetical protein